MTTTTAQRQRLRFDGLSHEPTRDGRCRITVRLEWSGETFEGAAEGLETHEGRLRASAHATLQGALAAAGERVHLDMFGVKAVRAFDGWVVVARLQGESGERSYKLLGSASCESEDGILHAAAMAVLDAGNRILERYVQR